MPIPLKNISKITAALITDFRPLEMPDSHTALHYPLAPNENVLGEGKWGNKSM